MEPQPLPILLYHSVSDDAPAPFRPYAVSTDQFRRHLDAIKAGGYTTLSMEQVREHLTTNSPLPHKAVGLTIDDGFEDFYSNALQPLSDRGFDATLYVVSGLLGATSTWLHDLGAGSKPMLSVEQLREIHSAGIEIGSHTITHPELDVIARERARREIRDSKNQLQDLLGEEVRSFAYPHGHFTRSIRDMAVASGYHSAVGVRNMMSHPHDHLFSLARITILSDITDSQFAKILDGGGGYVPAPGRELLRTKASRQRRRLSRMLR